MPTYCSYVVNIHDLTQSYFLYNDYSICSRTKRQNVKYATFKRVCDIHTFIFVGYLILLCL